MQGMRARDTSLDARQQDVIAAIVSTLNERQRDVVDAIVSRFHVPYPYVVYGPPGTGKTRTLAAAIAYASMQHNTHIKFGAVRTAAATPVYVCLCVGHPSL